MKRSLPLRASLPLIFLSMLPFTVESEIIERTAKDTITPIELDLGDTFLFTLKNGETRVLELLESGSDILLSNVYPDVIKKERPDHGVMYQIWIEVKIDGQPMRLTRYLCSQFSYSEPYYVNGMRIWFEYNQAPMAFMTGNRGGVPEKAARIVVNDMTDRIAPDTFTAWYRRSETIEAKEFANERIDARDNYKGDDMHMGGYHGATPHNGLDINMPRGTQMIAPIDFDDHMIFSNAHRWRGIRKWDNGSEWWLQSHHMFRMIAPEYEPLKQGTVYGEGAGTATGEVAHSHFALRVLENDQAYPVDAWLIFWQTFRDRQDARGDIRAKMQPVSPAVTGETVSFKSSGSRSGSGNALLYSWSFGDGSTSTAANPEHVYSNPGIYAVRLTIDDGQRMAHFVQNITVSGAKTAQPAFALAAPDEVEFLSWPVNAALLYGEDPKFMTHTLRFTARSSRPQPDPKSVRIQNIGTGKLETATTKIHYLNGQNWCSIDTTGSGNLQFIHCSVDSSGMAPGTYLAEVEINVSGSINERQTFRVQLKIEEGRPALRELTLLNSDPDFFATPWFWAPHSFQVNNDVDLSVNYGRWDRPMQPPALLTSKGKNRMGLSDRYFSNGYRKDSDQFFRFTPDLAAGTYLISTPPETPWDSTSAVNVRVHHATGDALVRYMPGITPVIGTFKFNEGRDGFVEFYAEDSIGQITADALIFENVDYIPVMTVTHTDHDHVKSTGSWSMAHRKTDYAGGSYLHDGNREKGQKSFRFVPIIRNGNHEVLLRWPKGENHATKVPVLIQTKHGIESRYINQKDEGNHWYSLGIFELDEETVWIEIKTNDTNGTVVADAVKLVPSSNINDIEGLIAHWSFEKGTREPHSNTIIDSKNSHALTLHNTKTNENIWAQGKVGERALKLDGIDDFALAEPLGLKPLQPCTIAAWVQLGIVDQPAETILFGFDGTESNTALIATIPLFGNRITVDIRDFAWTLQSERDTAWHHLALVWDGTYLSGYVDGKQTIKTGNLFGKETNDCFRVGSEGPFFNGAIDEIRIYGHDLNADQIQTIYTYGSDL